MTQLQDEMLIAMALTRFSVDFEGIDAELSERAWQLAALRVIENDVEPMEIVEILGLGDASTGEY